MEVAGEVVGEEAAGQVDSASWPCRFVAVWARTTEKPWASCKVTLEEFLSSGNSEEAVRHKL